MFRSKLIEKKFGYEKNFRWRGAEVTRVEGFSDAVFAFAVTLLVVSLEVPKTFQDLLITMRGFIVFGLCFAVLIMFWYAQYVYFRRFALNDRYVIVANAALLFVILFYIYPLKFLLTLSTEMTFGFGNPSQWASIIRADQIPLLFMIYSSGYFLVFFIFFLLYAHAIKNGAILDLNDVEMIISRYELHGTVIQMSISLLSIAIAFLGREIGAAACGLVYFLLFPLLAINKGLRTKALKKVSKKSS